MPASPAQLLALFQDVGKHSSLALDQALMSHKAGAPGIIVISLPGREGKPCEIDWSTKRELV